MAENMDYSMRTITTQGELWVNSKDLDSALPKLNVSKEKAEICSSLLGIIMTQTSKWK